MPCTTTLYAFCEEPPPQAVTFKVNESVAAIVGFPVRLTDVVLPDAVAVTPAGSAPDAIDHLYGVQPPLAATTAEYVVPTVPLGREVVVIARLADVFGPITTLYASWSVPPPQPVTFTVKESVAAVVGVPVMSSKAVLLLDTFAVTPAGNAPEAITHL